MPRAFGPRNDTSFQLMPGKRTSQKAKTWSLRGPLRASAAIRVPIKGERIPTSKTRNARPPLRGAEGRLAANAIPGPASLTARQWRGCGNSVPPSSATGSGGPKFPSRDHAPRNDKTFSFCRKPSLRKPHPTVIARPATRAVAIRVPASLGSLCERELSPQATEGSDFNPSEIPYSPRHCEGRPAARGNPRPRVPSPRKGRNGFPRRASPSSE